jgi:hypothetical protein
VAKLKSPQWLSQIVQTYKLTAPADPAIRWILPVSFFGITAALAIPGVLMGNALGTILAATSWAFALLITLYIFGRRAEKAAYSQIEGIPGAAAQVLTTLRAGWFTTPAVEINRSQEIVHRVVGRPGVILVIEAKPGSSIATSARQKTQRWIGEVPLHEVYVGAGEGQISLAKLNRTVMKLPRALRPAEVTDLRRKLDAAAGGSLPIPKGPMPKGMRVPRR